MSKNEVIAGYVLQPHAISRAVYRLSTVARKLVAMGMAIIPPDLSSRTAQFNFNEFCQALGIERSGDLYQRVKDAILECISVPITIDTLKEWKTFTWIQTAKIDKETGMITIIFSDGLAEYLIELKKMYARIDLQDLGKIQSLYALRIFEMAKSYESLSGKNGNKGKSWFFERKIEDLRKILGVEAGKYKLTRDFRIFVIEKPCEEINKSNLGIRITPEVIKKGSRIVAFRFSCEPVVRKLESWKKKGVPAIDAPPESLIPDNSLEAKELELLKTKYHDEYVEIFADLLKNPENEFMKAFPERWASRADWLACKTLRERHGIHK